MSSTPESDDSATNPYRAPLSTCVEAGGQCCSYCGRTATAAGNLVQSPDGHVFICHTCAETACNLLRTAQSPRKRLAWVDVEAGIINMALFSAILLAVNQTLAHQPASDRWFSGVVAALCVVGLACHVRKSVFTS